MLGPRLLVDVPAALWNAGPRGTARAGTPRRATNPKTGGRRPKERSSCQVSPLLFFNTVGAFKPVSLELYTLLAHVVQAIVEYCKVPQLESFTLSVLGMENCFKERC